MYEGHHGTNRQCSWRVSWHSGPSPAWTNGVNPQIAEQIITVAKQLGYRPGFDLKPVWRQKKLLLGFVLPEGQGIWADVMAGIERAAAELAEYNVEIVVRRFAGYNPINELLCINNIMNQGIEGLAVVPINDARIKARLTEISASGIPVVLVNQEMNGAEEVGALCYFGSDYLLAGRTAAGMLKLCHPTGRIELGIFCANKNMFSQSTRITGFLQEIDRLGLDCHLIHVMNVFRGTDGAQALGAYDMVLSFLKKHPETTALYTADGQASAVAMAIYDSGLSNKIIHITFDLHSRNMEELQNGSITVLIGQESVAQGYQPLKILYDYCVNGIAPQSRRILVKSEIFIPQNALYDVSVCRIPF